MNQEIERIIAGDESAVSQFNQMFSRAINEGRMMTAERIAFLYPLIREVNEEIDEIKREEATMELIYAVCDRVVFSFAALFDARDALPATVHKKIYVALTEWVGDVDTSLSGDALIDHLTDSVGDAVQNQMLKRAEIAQQKAA